MKKFGIFLGYAPRQLDPNQGISRLITFLTKGLIEQESVRVTIAAPGWLRGNIESILQDADIPLGAVDIITTRGEPYIIKLDRLWRRFKTKKEGVKRKRKTVILIERCLSYVVAWLSVSSTLLFIIGLIISLLVCFVLFIPGIILLSLMVFSLGVQSLLSKMHRSPTRRIAARVVRIGKSMLLSTDMINRVRANELDRVVKHLNRRSGVDVWYIPSMFWPEVAKLKGRKVMAAPDIVFFDFPGQYNIPGGERQIVRINDSLSAADHLICYSEYVKERHFVQRSGVPAEKISVIPHGHIDMSSPGAEKLSREQALNNISDFLQTVESPYADYLKGFSFKKVNFIFYSSQVRMHKNLEALVDVYETILRRHYRPIKLILTADIRQSERLISTIHKRGLQRDVLSIHSVPNEILASFYKLAKLQVTPTMFEGGFPFTFTEAFSVGTPSVMSRIPVVVEAIDDKILLDRMSFNPVNRVEMLNKILWGLDNREKLFALQLPLYQQLQKRDWRVVANEYIGIMDKVAAESRTRT